MKFLRTKITEIKRIKDLIILKIPFKNFNILPGQFFMIGTEKSNVLLNRPFSVSDFNGKLLTFRIKMVGKFTKFLTKLKSGDEIKIIGPCGNGLSFEELKKYEKIILIGGGIGIAPLIFFKTFLKKSIDSYLIFGIPSKNYLYFLNDIHLDNIIIYTEDGSYGNKGFPVNYLDKIENENTLVIACGPEPMYKALLNKNFETKVLVEQKMACGFGACLGCVIETIHGYKRVCIDGPVFDLREIKWK